MTSFDPSPAPTRDARQDARTVPALVQKHEGRLAEIDREVASLMRRDTQSQRLLNATEALLRVTLAGPDDQARQVEALEMLHYIFSDRGPKRDLALPGRIKSLMDSKPCLFTFLPGLDSHQTTALSSIVLTDRYNRVHSRTQVNLSGTLVRDGSCFQQKLPICLAPMRAVVGEKMIEACLAEGITPVMHRFRRPLDAANVDTDKPSVQTVDEAKDEKRQLAGRFGKDIIMACGVSPDSIAFGKELIQLGIGGICIDVAIGNAEQTVAAVLELKEFIRAHNLSTKIMVGNIDTEDAYYRLGLAGADIIKVGIGPGSACTTRGTTRAGAGQGSALMAVGKAQFIMGDSAPAFVADGGIQAGADIVVALALGAQGVMIGNLAARCAESPALRDQIDGVDHVFYFGEASRTARILEQGGVKPGMAVEGAARWIRAEGTLGELCARLAGELRNAFPYYDGTSLAGFRARYSPAAQLQALILGYDTGLHLGDGGHGAESVAHFGKR